MQQILKLVALVSIFAAVPIADLSAAPTAIDQEQLTDDLVAQKDATVIRDRKLADDRILAIMREDESQIRSLGAQKRNLERRLQLSLANDRTVRKQLAETSGALQAVRRRYRELVGQTAERDALWAAERAGFRAEASATVAQATPEMLEALRRFADGDRVGAYPIIEALTEAEIRGRQTAANIRAAVQMRQLAERRAVMHANGEASTGDLLGVWMRAARLDPGDFNTQIQIRRLAELNGDQDLAMRAAASASALAKTPAEKSMALVELGDVLERQGKTEESRMKYGEALDLERAASKSGDHGDRYNLSVSLKKMGEASARRGNLDEALKFYLEALDISEGLVRDYPSSFEAKRDLSVSLRLLADALITSGDRASALVFAERALDLDRALSAANLQSAVARRDLPMSLQLVGQLKDGPEGLALFEEALSICRKLLETDPDSATAQRDVSVALKYVGDYLFKAQSGQESLPIFEEAMAIDRKLARQDPANVVAKFDLFISLMNVGREYIGRRGEANARSYFDEAISLVQPLILANALNAAQRDAITGDLRNVGAFAISAMQPENAIVLLEGAVAIDRIDQKTRETDLAISLSRLSQALVLAGRLPEASVVSREAARIVQKRYSKDPKDTQAQFELYSSLMELGDALQAMGDMNEALLIYKEAAKLSDSLAAKDPSPDNIGNRALTSGRIGVLFDRNNRFKEAIPYFENALADIRRVAQESPSHRFVKDLPLIEGQLARAKKKAAGAIP